MSAGATSVGEERGAPTGGSAGGPGPSALPRPSVAAVLVALAAVLDLAVAELGRGVPTESLAWFRLLAHLGWGGMGVAVGGGLLAALGVELGRRRVAGGAPGTSFPAPLVVLGGLGVGVSAHLPFVGVAQGHPDTASWYTLAARLAEDPAILLGWSADPHARPIGGSHLHLPLVPASYALLLPIAGHGEGAVSLGLAGWAALLGGAAALCARRWTPGDRMAPWSAALGVCLLPALQAWSGWMLADLPLTALFLLLVAGLAPNGARPTRGWLAAPAALALLLTKVTSLPLLFGAAVGRLPARWGLGALAVAVVAVALAAPPRVEALLNGHRGLSAVGMAARPAWLLAVLLAAAWGWRGADGLRRLWVVVVCCGLPSVVLYAPPQHVARYALPVVALTVVYAATRGPRALVAYAVVSSAVVLYGGYLPLVRNHQGETLRAAVRGAEARGAARLWVYGDQGEARFGAAPLAALVDLYTPLPVVFGGDTQPVTGTPDRWWEGFPPLPSHRVEGPPAPGDIALLGGVGRPPTAFLDTHPEWRRVDVVRGLRASSEFLPAEMIILEPTGVAPRASVDP